MTIVEFLEARIAEDEAIANAAAGDEGCYWLQDQDLSLTATDGPHGVAWSGLVELSRRPVVGRQMERFDPYRVLAECKAKRAVLARHVTWKIRRDPGWEYALPGVETVCWYCTSESGDRWVSDPCPDVRDLASVYADHPDFDPAWA